MTEHGKGNAIQKCEGGKVFREDGLDVFDDELLSRQKNTASGSRSYWKNISEFDKECRKSISSSEDGEQGSRQQLRPTRWNKKNVHNNRKRCTSLNAKY